VLVLRAAGRQEIKVDIRKAQIEAGKRIQSSGGADVRVGRRRRGGCRSALIHDCCTVGDADLDVNASPILHKTITLLSSNLQYWPVGGAVGDPRRKLPKAVVNGRIWLVHVQEVCCGL
jgi:hypothetical protein